MGITDIFISDGRLLRVLPDTPNVNLREVLLVLEDAFGTVYDLKLCGKGQRIEVSLGNKNNESIFDFKLLGKEVLELTFFDDDLEPLLSVSGIEHINVSVRPSTLSL